LDRTLLVWGPDKALALVLLLRAVLLVVALESVQDLPLPGLGLGRVAVHLQPDREPVLLARVMVLPQKRQDKISLDHQA